MLLKPGGRMVYSTCSLNPFENEAVVAALLRWAKGRLQLIDIRMEYDNIMTLKENDDNNNENTNQHNRAMNENMNEKNTLESRLIVRPGLQTWKCDIETILAGETEEEKVESMARMPPIPSTLYPPVSMDVQYDSAPHKKYEYDNGIEIVYNLDRCLRIYPQDQNTGGFFVAVFHLLDDSEYLQFQLQKQQNGVLQDAKESDHHTRNNNYNDTIGNNGTDHDEYTCHPNNYSVPASVPDAVSDSVPLHRLQVKSPGHMSTIHSGQNFSHGINQKKFKKIKKPLRIKKNTQISNKNSQKLSQITSNNNNNINSSNMNTMRDNATIASKKMSKKEWKQYM